MDGKVTSSPVIDYTIGRATNDVLEQTVAVWFKDEDEVEGEAIGPVYLQIAGSPGTHTPEQGMVPLARGDGPEWHTEALAEALAKELGVPVIWS